MYERDEDSPRETPATRSARIRDYQSGFDPWFQRKRCETGDGDPQNMECMVCGAAFGEACRDEQ